MGKIDDTSENQIKTHTNLLERLEQELMRGFALIEGLSDDVYLRANNGIGSIGAHVRHNLDFTNNFLSGLECGKIDYNCRERDIRIEKDRQHAKERFLFLIEWLKRVSHDLLDENLYVRSEVDETNWYKSSGARELEFVCSHTVHHYALISEKLRLYGVKVPGDFGVAPSTLRFWADNDEWSKVA